MSIYGTKTAEEMGKKAKEHRKKVEARNQKIVAARKKFGKELEAEFRKQAAAHSQTPVYASTGDFVAKNWELLQGEEDKAKLTEFLEENSGVKFS